MPHIVAILIFLPQFILKTDLFDGLLTTSDIVGTVFLVLATFSFKRFSNLVIAYLSLILYVVTIGVCSVLYRADGGELILAYCLRLLLITSPVLLSPRFFSIPVIHLRYLLIFALLFNIIILVQYIDGSQLFVSNHTRIDEFGSYISRFGGLPLETGAFAFNSYLLFMFSLLLMKYANSNGVLRYTLPVAVIEIALGYIASTARVIFLGPLIAFLFKFSRNVLFKVLFITVAVFIIAYAANNLTLGMFNELMSARIEHWFAAFDLISKNPSNILFGYGYHMGIFVLELPIVNFFLVNLIELGIFGTLLLIIFIMILLYPIYRSRVNNIDKFLLYLWGGVFLLSLFNDVNTYYQSVPLLLYITLYRRYQLLMNVN